MEHVQEVDHFLKADAVVGFVVGRPRDDRPVAMRSPVDIARWPRPDLPGTDAWIWAHRADELAAAAVSMLNRRDACGGYRGRNLTTRKQTDSDWIDIGQALRLHFPGERCIGLHSPNPASGACRWLAFDIDAHHEDADPEANFHAAEESVRRLAVSEVQGWIFDSDGRGGLHVWAPLTWPMRSEDAFDLSHAVIQELPVRVEAFPKQPQIPSGGYGNWIRLPGRHHKREHWSRVWRPDEERWRTAEETIDALLEMMG